MKISKGENILVRRNLYQADGTTPLLISSLSLAKVTLRQNNQVVITYVLGTNPEIRPGVQTNQIELEITKSLSASLQIGELIAEWEFEVNDSEFQVDGVNNQQFIETILHVLPY